MTPEERDRENERQVNALLAQVQGFSVLDCIQQYRVGDQVYVGHPLDDDANAAVIIEVLGPIGNDYNICYRTKPLLDPQKNLIASTLWNAVVSQKHLRPKRLPDGRLP